MVCRVHGRGTDKICFDRSPTPSASTVYHKDIARVDGGGKASHPLLVDEKGFLLS